MSENVYLCKNCNGNLAFDPTTQKLKCEYCDSLFDVSEYETSKEETAEEKTVEKLDVYHCETCNAEIVVDETTTATFCVFCGNATILRGELQGEFKPDYVVPFEKTQKDAVNTFLAECKKRPLVPDVFTNPKNIEKIKGVYVPYFLFDSTADASIKAECTTESRRRFGNKTTITTRHYMVERGGITSFDHVPADASSKMDDAFMSSIEPFDFTKLQPFTTAYMSGFLAERNDVEKDTCYEYATKRIVESSETYLKNDIQGYKSVKLISKDIQPKLQAAHLTLMPVFMVYTIFESKPYIFAMNAQSGKFVGEFPLCKKKTVKYFLIFAAICYAISIAVFFLGGF